MIRIADPVRRPAWHEKFLSMLPAIARHARVAFRHLNPDAREEAVQAVICNACSAIARLAELGKLDLAYAGVLARYAVAQVRDGRMTGGHLNCKDIMSRYCQRQKSVTVDRLDKFNEQDECREEAVCVDTRNSPVPEIVAFRCDFKDWLKLLSRRDRQLAKFLAEGNRTKEAARKFGVCQGRISQLRNELHDAWQAFVGDEPDDASAVPT